MPRINQRIMHRGVMWIIDTIWQHPTQPGRYEVEIWRGCCWTTITL